MKHSLPQYSLAWFFGEIALVAVACVGLRTIIFPGGHTPNEEIVSCYLFLIGGCGAIGGLFKRVVVGLGAGVIIAIVFNIMLVQGGAFAAVP